MLSRQSTSRRRAASESGKHPEIESPESKVACEHTRNRVLNGIGRAHMYVRIGLGTVRGRPCVRPRGSDPNPTMRARAPRHWISRPRCHCCPAQEQADLSASCTHAHVYVRIGLGTVRGRPCVRPRGSDPNPTMRVRAADNPVHLCRSVSANESLTDSG